MVHEIVVALIIRDQKILLGKRAAEREFFPDVWDLFGGHVEPGEEQDAALVRELQEELGVTPREWTFVETLSQPLPDAGELIAHLYLVPSWDGMLMNRQLEEHSEVRWFSLAEAVQLALADPSYPDLFRRYLY